MLQNKEFLNEIKLVGISARTSNAFESNSETAQIGKTFEKFYAEDIQSKIQNKINPGKIFAVYTNYESDKNGKYTYFLGQEVDNFENLSSNDLETLIIPATNYIKFTSNPTGPFPSVVIDMWQKIWKMEDEKSMGAERSYIADFEVYDERAQDYNNACVDIYIGIKSDF